MVKKTIQSPIYFTGTCSGKYHAVRDGRHSIPLHQEIFDLIITEFDGSNPETTNKAEFDTFKHDLYSNDIRSARCIWQDRAFEMRFLQVKVQTMHGPEAVTQSGSSSYAQFNGQFCAEVLMPEEVEVAEPVVDQSILRHVEERWAHRRRQSFRWKRPVNGEGLSFQALSSGCFTALGVLYLGAMVIMMLVALIAVMGLVPFVLIVALMVLSLFGARLTKLLPAWFSGSLLNFGRTSVRTLLWLWTSLLVPVLLFGLLSFLFGSNPIMEHVRPTTAIVKDSTKAIGNDTLIIHTIQWTDRSHRKEAVEWKVWQSQVRQSKRFIDSLGRSPNMIRDWRWIYGEVASHDSPALGMVFQAFDSLRTSDSMDKSVEMRSMVNCVQSIPYCPVVTGQCPTGAGPCMSNVPFGLNTPAGFTADLKGDCDTRVLLLYMLLRRAGVDVAMMLSDHYEHAMLGISTSARGNFLVMNGKRYYFWETTATGFDIGDMHPSVSDLRYWRIIRPSINAGQNQPS